MNTFLHRRPASPLPAPRPGYLRPSTGAEFLRRARAAALERVAIGLCLGLALVSGSFAAYSITGASNTYSVQPFLPALGGGFAWKRNAVPVREAALDLDPTTTGSLPDPVARPAAPERAEPAPKARGYVLRRVSGGAALLEGPEGLRQVVPGAVLPGAGRILSIRATGAGWVVITSETIIGPTPL
ncbi:hypothetical protein [Methylobacterium sp. J-068]|uniref:hypothetical protein n=1 Tax=Methylobacterium sp. J-068 TaxID=2836649 RepID=UPI001FBB5104|nr:hypothetical protein [Methylobacterium sp. J-068]MCJ2036282.1 hypothetical protein [Methylobacterium sp. J-068]